MFLLLLTHLPPPVGRGARRSYPLLAPPSPAQVPAVFSRLGGERSVWILLAPHSLALLTLPLRGGRRRGKRRVLPLFPLGIAAVLVLASAEREDRDLAALAPALLIESILSSVHAPALAIFVESAPMIVKTCVSTAHAILQNAPSSVLGLGSVPTAPELLRSEAIVQNAMARAPHRFWGKRRSELTSVPYAKCF